MLVVSITLISNILLHSQSHSQSVNIMSKIMLFSQRSSGDHYLGYHGWKDTNRQYQVGDFQDPAHFFPSSKVGNISIIVRLEFDRFRYRHNRIKKTYKRYFLPKKILLTKWKTYNNLKWMMCFGLDSSFLGLIGLGSQSGGSITTSKLFRKKRPLL